jgi:hypothetical protein
MFAFLDEIQEKIGSLPIRAAFDDGADVFVQDLQVFPSTGDATFRLASVVAQSTRLAEPL